MKTNTLLSVIFSSLILLASCVENPCSKLDCAANGTCDPIENRCDCNPGWEGDKCETETKAKFFGNYSYTQNCTNGGTTSGTCIIGNGPSSFRNSITISSLKGYSISGEVTTTNGINFPSALSLGAAGGFTTCDGTGLKTGDKIDLSLTFDDQVNPSNNDVCTFVLTKM